MIDKAHIKSLVEQHLQASDCFLVEIKLSPNRLAVFIDKPAGITLPECTALSRFLTQELELSGILETHDLDVSSPGMDTPLVVPQQYLRRIGREMKIINSEGRELKGELLSADENGIELKEIQSKKENKKKVITEVTHALPYSAIREAKLVLNFKSIK